MRTVAPPHAAARVLHGLALSAAVLGAPTLAAQEVAAPPAAAAAVVPPTIDACYVPASGTIYRINTAQSPAPGAPANCLSALHVKFTWNQQGEKGDKGDPGAQGPAGPAGPPGSALLCPAFAPDVEAAAARGGTAAQSLQLAVARGSAAPAALSVSDPTIGEVVLFAGNFAPRGWAFTNGQLLPIVQNQALFAILGTTYGGDGRTTFALPDTRGLEPACMHYIIALQGIFPSRP